MNFLEVHVETSRIGLEIVSGVFYQAGITGLIIEDAEEFQEFLCDPKRNWDYVEETLPQQKEGTGITFYVTDNAYGIEQLNGIRSSLRILKDSEQEFDIGTLTLTLKNVKEEDWANNWKKYFKPFPVGKRLLIKPSWETVERTDGRRVLEIDPGHIFGTGTHETTQLCLEALEKWIQKGERVLDVGCGSGILSIASLLLGAESADAIDIDPNAVEIAYENSDRNGIDRNSCHVYSGNLLEDETLFKSFAGKGYTLVVANIVADVIIALADVAPQLLKNGGLFVTSGIILERLADVKEALEKNGFAILSVETKKDWAVIVSRRQNER